MTTPRLGAPELVVSQAIPETTVNEIVRYIEQGASLFPILDKDLTAPPGSPVDGRAYIVAATATGAWTGKENKIAFYLSAAWAFITPTEGMFAYPQDENALYYFDGAAWAAFTAGSGAIANDSVTFAKMQNIATDRLIGRDTAGTGDPEEVALSTGLVWTGSGSIAADIDTDATLAGNSNAKLPSQAAVKSYVDGLVMGLSWKRAVRAATTANGTLASAFENGDTVDGVTLATGDRILIKNQSSGAENGIYVVAASGAPSRATDADSGAELVNATAYVSEGTANADTQWTCITNATITPGSTSLTFAQLSSGAGSLQAANNLSDVADIPTALRNLFAADISPSQITSNQNDYNPTSLATATMLRLNSDASRNITGLQGGADGRVLVIANVGSNDIVLKDESGSSTAGYRFALDADLTLAADTSAVIIYDATSSRWRLIARGRASTSGGVTFASAAEYRAGTEAAKALAPDQAWAAADYVPLTDAATVAVDMSLGFNFSLTIGGNRTLGAPSNTKNGQTGCIVITQDGTGTRTLAYHANWKFAGGTDPTLSTAAGAVDLLFYQVISSTSIYATLIKAIA